MAYKIKRLRPYIAGDLPSESCSDDENKPGKKSIVCVSYSSYLYLHAVFHEFMATFGQACPVGAFYAMALHSFWLSHESFIHLYWCCFASLLLENYYWHFNITWVCLRRASSPELPPFCWEANDAAAADAPPECDKYVGFARWKADLKKRLMSSIHIFVYIAIVA